MSLSLRDRRKKLCLAEAFLRAANKCKIKLRDRRSLIEMSKSLEELLDIVNLAPERAENYSMRGDLFASFQIFYRQYYQELYNNMKLPEQEIDVILCNDANYPERLKLIDSSPCLLFACGNSWQILNQQNVVSVVGSRTPSHYGMEVTRYLLKDFASCDLLVISGGAVGIDALAHRYSLEQGIATCAVLGSGLKRVYPQSNKQLFREIVDSGGLIVSEFSLIEAPKKQNFPQRNRLIAAMADAVIITEAGEKSGTLITADYAADYGRDVYAVPGSIFSGRSRSCHQLIREGATLIQSAADLPFIKTEPERPLYENINFHGSESKPDDYMLSEKELIIEQLKIAPAQLSELAARTNISTERIALILAKLQSEATVERARGRYVLKTQAYNL